CGSDRAASPPRSARSKREADCECAEPHCGKDTAGDVEPPIICVRVGRRRIARHIAPREQDRCRSYRQIDEENSTPAAEIDEPAPEHGANCSGNGASRRPDSNCSPLGCTREALSENRETVGGEHCRADTLQQPP